MKAMIATWCMSHEGVGLGMDALCEGASLNDALELAIGDVEDNPYYKSVGYGGLPNEEEQVELDAGFMDGDTLGVGAVMALKDFANPIKLARRLSHKSTNCLLAASGAEKWAAKHGFIRKNMLTDRAKRFYKKRLEQENMQVCERKLKPYAGHDTVGMVAFSDDGQSSHVSAATSTSGLFMKKSGRVGDSPIVGSGFYADSDIGGACATGLGEDLMRGCISYEIVRKMSEGMDAQSACERAVLELSEKLCKLRGEAGDISVVALGADGSFGCATNINNFSFVYAADDHPAKVYLCHPLDSDGKCKHVPASQEWIDAYYNERMRPIEEI